MGNAEDLNIRLRGAIRDGDNAAARAAIRAGAASNGRDVLGITMLHWAAYFGRADLCDLLQLNGADSSAIDPFGKTPADWAGLSGHAELAEILTGQSKHMGEPVKTRQMTSKPTLER